MNFKCLFINCSNKSSIDHDFVLVSIHQVSFVNSINTIKGGTHVEYVTSQIASHVMSIVNKKNKNANLRPHNVKNHLWVFVNCLIDNPAFDSQTKETLTTRQGSFGSKCDLSQEFLKKGNCSYCDVKLSGSALNEVKFLFLQWLNQELWKVFSHGLISSRIRN